jgi:hypothetical protein
LLGLIVGACGASAAHWIWGTSDFNVAVVAGGTASGLIAGILLAIARRHLDAPLWRAACTLLGTGGGIVLLALYLTSQGWWHVALLCGIMALMVGFRLVQLIEVLK